MASDLSTLLRETADELAQTGIDTARLDAEILLAHTLETTVLAMKATARLPNNKQMARYMELIARRQQGEPVAYLIGYQPFWNSDFLVSPETLIPRQDTETLVEVVLQQRPLQGQILDLGTGTGCVLLSLLQELPEMRGLGLDVSPAALTVARENTLRLNLENRCDYRESDWFACLRPDDGFFSVIVANPPYIPTPDIMDLMRDVKGFEPKLALDGGPDGLEPYRIIAKEAPFFLSEGGLLAVEVGILQSNDVYNLFEAVGLEDVKITRDLPGVERVVSGKKRSTIKLALGNGEDWR